MLRNGRPAFHGTKGIGQEAQEEGRVSLALIPGGTLFCVLVSIGNRVQCFKQYFILVVPPLQRLKSFES